MKKITLVIGLTMALVLAFAATAFAAAGLPDRSSAFLKGATGAYVSWNTTVTNMALPAVNTAVTSGVSALDMQTPHGGYTTSTIKCQVCHSAHKASVTGEKLLASTAAEACAYCHAGATAITSDKISEGNRHGEVTGCTNGYCHSLSPHGAWTSEYASLKSMLLNSNADPLIAAAIRSGVSGVEETATLDYTRGVNANLPVGTNGASAADSIGVFNPLVTADMMNNADQTTNALARSVATGYICANGGCHINGSFNALTEDAFLGKVTGTDVKATSRTAGIKGHILGAVPTVGGVSVPASGGSPTVMATIAYAPTARCNSCHDSVDARIGNVKQFPHGNNNIDASGVQVAYAGGTTAAWFTLADNFGGTSVNTNVRTPTGAGAYTSAMDGACLKCHKSATGGVGVDF